MNYYFDLDNTIYETAKLTDLMLQAIAKKISENSKQDFEDMVKYAKNNFNSTIDNIFKFAKEVSEKYEVNPEITLNAVNDVIDNGKNIVFDDARRFIEKLKIKDNKIFLLTYIKKGNERYQMQKIMGANIIDYFDGITVTNNYKFTLDLKYEEGIFFDDDPRDLNGLIEKNARKVIRIRKENNKRSKIDMENSAIEEYISFDDIKI